LGRLTRCRRASIPIRSTRPARTPETGGDEFRAIGRYTPACTSINTTQTSPPTLGTSSPGSSVDLFSSLDGFGFGGPGSAPYFGHGGPGLMGWIERQLDTEHLMLMGANTY
jgi:hypothetical protein